MEIKNPEKRLKKFWGKVDKKHIGLIAEWVKGSLALDVGSGFGTTSGEIARQLNIKCIGIDYDNSSLEIAKKLYPDGTFLFENCENLSFPDNYFDTIILRDVLHHLKGESDFEKSGKELIRVAKNKTRIIIVDPNVNFILKTARKIASHRDEECTYEDALKIVKEMKCEIIHKKFNTVFSLPLSGGYVGVSLVPDVNFIQQFILFSEMIFEKIINAIGLGKFFCWRYLIVAEVIK